MSFVSTQTQDQILKKKQTNKDFNQKSEMGGLSFLQSLSDLSAIPRNRVETEEIKETYIHPISAKHSVSKLSKKSLEMCTESLGTETGSESGDELSFLAFEATTYYPRKDTNFATNKPKINRNNSFPPPIKFVDGSKGNRIVRFNGEDGRLVVQAIRVSSRPSCLIAERSEGRLRLCLSSEEEDEEEEEAEETEDGINENNENLEGKNGNKKISRLSGRCKENGDESNKPMLTWKRQQFWVSA